MGKERENMIVHGCSDGFIVEMDEDEFNRFMEWLIHADLDDDNSKEE